MELPKKFKPVHKLYYPNKANEDSKKSTSAHRTNTAKRVARRDGSHYYIYKHINPVSLKSKKREASIAEGEAACAAWAKFLAPENVPTYRVCYDEATQSIVSVISTAIENFKTNAADPLLEKDTIVTLNGDSGVQTEILQQRKLLSEAIASLETCIRERNKKNSSYIPGLKKVKNLWNRHATGETTSIKILDYLKEFKHFDNDVKYCERRINELINQLQARYDYVLENKAQETDYKKEILILAKALKTAGTLQGLNKKTSQPLSIPILEKLDKKAREDKEQLTIGNTNRLISIIQNGKTYSITAKSLKNFRNVKRQITQLGTRYLSQDTDGHNQNMTKDGWMIDFDMAKLPILYSFRQGKYYDDYVRAPKKDMFVITENDIVNFPNIKDAKFYYWAAKQVPEFEQSVISKLSFFYTITENFFKPEDNEVFTNLANNNIAIFYKYKLFLKYAVLTPMIYATLIALHVRPDATFIDRREKIPKEKKLLDEMIKDEANRMQEMRKVLVNIPQFKTFLDENGEYAWEMIKEEILAEKAKYQAKIDGLNQKYDEDAAVRMMKIRPYQRIVDALDMNIIEENYKIIFKEAEAEYCQHSDESPYSSPVTPRAR
jgi:hypothetical protein